MMDQPLPAAKDPARTPDGKFRKGYSGNDRGRPKRFATLFKHAAAGAPSDVERRRVARGRATGPCPGRLRIWSNKQREYVCHRCGELWKYRYQLRGEVQESVKPAGFEGSISRWTDVGKQLHDFLNDDRYRWESRFFVANVMGATIRWLVQYGPTEFPEASFSWNRWQVHERVKAGEREWTRRLISAGIDFGRCLAGPQRRTVVDRNNIAAAPTANTRNTRSPLHATPAQPGDGSRAP